MNVGSWTRAFAISFQVERTLVEVTEISRRGDDGRHRRDIEAKQGASHDGHGRNDIDIADHKGHGGQ